MASLNRCTFICRLGKDPEIRYTQSGTAVASFSGAVSERFKNKAGEWEEKTEWINFVLWAKLAELAGEYLKKGNLVYIEGRFQTRKWQDREGNDRYSSEIVGTSMQFLTPKGDGDGSGSGRSHHSPAGHDDYHDPGFNPDDDIPFRSSPRRFDSSLA